MKHFTKRDKIHYIIYREAHKIGVKLPYQIATVILKALQDKKLVV